MGDRSNIKISKYDGSSVYLYSHYLGERIIESAIVGLQSGRVGDPAYLARIIFQHMIRKDPEGETGFGISAGLEDNEHPILTITGEGKVYFEGKTEPIFASAFVAVVQNIEGWKRLAQENRLYEVLIEKLKG